MSKIVSTVTCLRIILWILAFVLYASVVCLVPLYRSKWPLFIVSYGITISSALLPDFYFQGIEKMKYITIINVLIRLIFICSTFVVIKSEAQYLLVPVLWSIGYLLGGIYSLYVVFGKHNLKIIRPTIKDYKFHLRETTPIFLSDVMLNIKDKISYNLMGIILGMADVVVYDIGTKIVNLLSKPTQILSAAIFPSMSKNPDKYKTKRIMIMLFLTSISLVGLTSIFLPYIVKFFIHEEVDLLPLRIYLIVPIFTGLSYYIPSCVFVAFGRNRYVLYSTLFSTFSFIIILTIMWTLGILNSVMNFIILSVLTYFAEMFFRLLLSLKTLSKFPITVGS